ncbi:MAG: adenosylmethionine decarboxylase [Desulfurococcales archaeon]|nr:adenosylmethionine decarboxylase [Desulfurococcales archaeon]
MVQVVSREAGVGVEAGVRVYGRHVYGNLYECANVDLLRDAKGLEELVLKAASEGNMKVLDVKSWKIGEGVSVVAIILESHITIHTWPEFRFATVDVYSCGSHTNPRRAFEVIVEALKPSRVEEGEADRTLE